MNRFVAALCITLLSVVPVWAEGMYVYPQFQAFDSSGSPLNGGKLYTYITGTTTNKATYSDAALTTPNANPVILDSRGEAEVYGSGVYKFLLKDSSDTTIWTIDPAYASVPGYLEGSATWNPASIADGNEEAKEVTVTGAALGDFAIASFSLDVTDLVLDAQVTAANTVTCVLANNTGGAIDLGSGTARVKVLKQ